MPNKKKTQKKRRLKDLAKGDSFRIRNLGVGGNFPEIKRQSKPPVKIDWKVGYKKRGGAKARIRVKF